MSDLLVFTALVALIAGGGAALGIIVAGRLDRLTGPPDSEPASVEEHP